MPNDDFFYCQKSSDRATMTRTIPNWVQPGMLVTFSTHSLMVGFFYRKVDLQGKETSETSKSNQDMTVLVTRVDPILQGWIDFIWGDEVYRINAQASLVIEIAKKAPIEPRRVSEEDLWWNDTSS